MKYNRYKARHEKELRRANAAEARLHTVCDAVERAGSTALRFQMDVEHCQCRLPEFMKLAAAKLYDDIRLAHETAIGVR